MSRAQRKADNSNDTRSAVHLRVNLRNLGRSSLWRIDIEMTTTSAGEEVLRLPSLCGKVGIAFRIQDELSISAFSSYSTLLAASAAFSFRQNPTTDLIR